MSFFCEIINFCLTISDYTFIHRFKYLAVVDVDEFISPSINASTSGSVVQGEGIKLFDLLDDLDRELSVGSFVFANVFHYTSWPSIQENNVSSSSIPDLVTQTKVMRKTISEPHGKRSKYVVRPEGVMLAGNHAVHRLAKGERFIHSNNLLFWFLLNCKVFVHRMSLSGAFMESCS